MSKIVKGCDKVRMNFKEEILRSIQLLIDEKISLYKADKTYKSVVKEINKKGYLILDSTGNERTVQCCIPGISLEVGQSVWVKEPMGDLKGIHICGVINRTK